jgi:hypothetical protein
MLTGQPSRSWWRSTTRRASQIASWVEQNFTATTVGGTTLYDLSSAGSGTLTA